jgi:predicted P-loop ATPase
MEDLETLPTEGKGKVNYLWLLDCLSYDFRRCTLDGKIHAVVKETGEIKPLDDEILPEIYVEADGFCPKYSSQKLWNNLAVRANRQAYNPIQDFIKELPKWDGKDKFDTLANALVGDSKERALVARWLKLWCIYAIKKLYDPKIFFPVLVLVGPQKVGKSQFLYRLALSENEKIGKYVIEGTIRPDDKDHEFKLSNTFIWIANELDAVTRKNDVSKLKDFITKIRVSVRKAFNKFDTEKPVITSFLGSVNNLDGFLQDATGNRRFLIVDCEKLDYKKYAHVDFLQVWAQAKAEMKQQENTWNDVDENRQKEINEQHFSMNEYDIFLQEAVQKTSPDQFLATADIQNFFIEKMKKTPHPRIVAGFFKKEFGVSPATEKSGQNRKKGYYGFSLA